jgi:hypothetical protein
MKKEEETIEKGEYLWKPNEETGVSKKIRSENNF